MNTRFLSQAERVSFCISSPVGILQLKCACGTHTAGNSCDECSKKKEELSLQRMATNKSSQNEVPPIVHEVLQSTGESLDATTRAFFESRFNQDFSTVRIHTDSIAAESAHAVNAVAYTVGSHIAFGSNRFAPQTASGQHLIAHELAHTIQQNESKGTSSLEQMNQDELMEKEADSYAQLALNGGTYHPVSQTVLHIARQVPSPQTPSATPATTSASLMSRKEFDRIMMDHYRLTSIRTGTFQDQAFGNLRETEWRSWDPGSSSEVYGWIVTAFANFEKKFGGLPAVKEILFFDSEYHRNDQGNPERSTVTGASYALGRLVIYKAIQLSNRMLNVQGALETPTSEQAVKRNVTHELGHGLAETALTQLTDQPPGADPDLFKDYRRAVGWTAEEKLYDIQEPLVKEAFSKSLPPPERFQIKPENAITGLWKERPLTSYMSENASDDFSEAIMAYVNEPERLKKFSPARYDFIEKRKARWLASGQPKINIWEQAKQGGPPRTLKPSRPPTIWEQVKEAK